MDRRTENEARVALWIERLAWHAAAGAALAVMLLVLLGSLRWLDEIAPRAEASVGAAPPVLAGERAGGASRLKPGAVVDRPSG